MSDISIAGEAAQPLPDTFHSLLQVNYLLLNQVLESNKVMNFC